MNESDTTTPLTETFHQSVIEGPLHAIGPRYRDFARTLERRCAELSAALELQTRINRQACVDWADDDTAIKAACKPFGIDVEGDSYGVPTMVDCVLKLAARCAELEAALKAK